MPLNKTTAVAMPSTNPKRRTITMRKVENGFTVNVSYDTPREYVDKTYVAKDEAKAKKLANSFL
jgi:hypothetical protein|tara:strand:+ start:343 stop:534 length:192 start_codon:yes stop_codon:yes gene_type:complete